MWSIKPTLYKKLSLEQIRQAAQDQLANRKLEVLVFGDQGQIGYNLENQLRSVIPVENVIRVKAKDNPEQAKL